MPRRAQERAHISQLFKEKKQRILLDLATPVSDYFDKSPKGSVDVQILNLIDLINSHEGWVTTSSCAGRAAVFLEGAKDDVESEDLTTTESPEDAVFGNVDGIDGNAKRTTKIKATPGGKGGGRWLYVSHDPIPSADEAENDSDSFADLFGLNTSIDQAISPLRPAPAARLIHLQYSPLILHIFCASLRHAKPLLAAAINAGFRESGVQSLKVLDDPGSGVMLAVRTSGLVFETVVGTSRENERGRESVHGMVTEEYLRMCATVINERFEWNEVRKQRLMKEIAKILQNQEQDEAWEDDDARARRKREEGLRRHARRGRKTSPPLPDEAEVFNTDLSLLDIT